MSTIVTRFAPSPTGYLHAGNYRTAVFAYLFAKKHGGNFVLRIEDTDRERSKAEFEENIHATLEWLGIVPDARYRQSEHAPRHESLLRALVEQGAAYVSKETPKDPGGRSEVIRFRNPNRHVTFTDAIRGTITFDTTELGDFVIARSFTEPVFHFAVVADDWDAGVTHVIRGEDHISNTPRQMLIGEALGAPTPVYAHLPLVLGPDRAKLSKRRGAKALLEYRALGYLPETLFNFMAILGWRADGDRELYFDRAELIDAFDLADIHKGGAIFDEEKLRWMNKEHLGRLSDDQYRAMVVGFLPDGADTSSVAAAFAHRAPLHDLRERIHSLGEVSRMAADGEFDFYAADPKPAAEALVWKKDPSAASALKHLTHVAELWSKIAPEAFSSESAKAAVFDYAEAEGRGAVLWPLRYALSGRDRSPDPFTIAEGIGREAALRRIRTAIRILDPSS